MTNNNSIQNEQERNRNEYQNIHTLDSITLKNEYDRLNHKYLLQDHIKQLSDNEKDKIKKDYQEIYGPEFGNVDMSKEEKKQYFEIKEKYEHKEGKNGIKKIEKIHADLIRSPLPDKVEIFPKEDPNGNRYETVPSQEQVRILLSSLPTEMLAIFDEYFIVSFFKLNWQDQNTDEAKKINEHLRKNPGETIVEKYQDKLGKDKFRINVDIGAFEISKDFNEDGLKYTKYTFNASKFLYTICRAMLATIKDKKEFTDFAKNIEKLSDKKIDNKCSKEHQYDDWLALFLSDPKKFEKINPELKDAAIHWLKNSFNKENFIDPKNVPDKFTINSFSPNENYLNLEENTLHEKKYWKDKITGEKIQSKGWISFLDFTKNIGLGFIGSGIYGIAENFNEIKLAFQEGYLSSQIEDTDKEVKKLLARDLSGSDYHKMLRKPLYYNNEDKMKALIMVLAEKNAYHWQFGQLWLWRFDNTFQKTQGREVSMKGFDFITKISKLAGTKYKAVGTIEYKQYGTHFIHNPYANQVERFDAIFENFSLRDIQRAAPELFNNLYCPETQKFLDINAKLGQKNMSEKDEFYIQNDINLKDILPQNEAENFVKNMQEYESTNHDQGFNRLVDPVVISLVKKYLQESRREPMLFNMYTSTMVRRGFEYYKDYVEEPSSSIKQSEKDHKELKDDLEKHHFDPEEALDDKAYEDIDLIYKNYAQEEKALAYTSGKEKTKYGRIKELMRQSQIKVQKSINNPELNIADELKNYINSQLIKFNEQKQISVEEINKFRVNLEKELSTIDSQSSQHIRKALNEHFKNMESYSIIKAYQGVFKPYEKVIYQKKDKNFFSADKSEKFKKWYLLDLLPEKSSIKQKMSDIESYSDNIITFSDSEKRKLAKLDYQQAIPELTNMLLKKLSLSEKSTDNFFVNNYDKLNNLYFNANQALLYPDQFKDDIPNIIAQFNSLDLIPDEIKEHCPHDLKSIIAKLRIAKVIADNYYQTNELKRQYRNGREAMGYDQMREYEDDYDAEQAEAA